MRQAGLLFRLPLENYAIDCATSTGWKFGR